MRDRFFRFGRGRADALVSAGLFGAAFVLYVQTMAPTVAAIYDDSLEFPLVVHRLAIAHQTGYPLYVLLGKLFSLLPAGDVAYRLHLLSAASAAGAVAILYLAARYATLHPLAALAASLMLAVSPVFWSQALIAEVYGLHALLVAGTLAVALRWGESEQRGAAPLALACLLGLGLAHHRTVVLLWPGLLMYVVARRRHAPLTAATGEATGRRHGSLAAALRLTVAFCLPLLLYLYLPLRGLVTTSLDGTYQNTVQGLASWILASNYTAFLSDNPLQQAGLGLQDYVNLFRAQLGAAGLLLSALGTLWLAFRRQRLFALLGLWWLAVTGFVHLYRVADAPVFLIPAFMVTALAAGAGVHALARLSLPNTGNLDLGAARAWVAKSAAAAALIIALVVPAAHLAHNIHQLDRSQDWGVYNYAIDVLGQPLEQGAHIVGILGEMTLLRYMQETRALRPDIVTIALDDDAQRLAAAARLLESGRPVYLTRAVPGLEKSYSLSSVGPLLRASKPGQAVAGPLPGAASSNAVFGERIALLSYRLAGLSSLRRQAASQQERAGAVESGARLRLCLVWQARQPALADYHVTIRLLTPTQRLLWQRDAGPVQDGYPTSAWRAGEVVTDCHDLLAPIGTVPGAYDLEIGLYDPATLAVLPASGQAGLARIGPVSIIRPEKPINLNDLPLHRSPATAGLQTPGGSFDDSLAALGIQRIVRANLQNEFTLYGFGLPQAPLAPGQAVDVTLLWQAARPPLGDRVIFVQLIGKNGVLAASQEGQPAGGLYPTHSWERGEVIRDVMTLFLPPDTPDGLYRLEAGMYDQSGAPLTVLRLTRRSLDHVDLGTVEVRGRPRSQVVPSLRNPVNARLGTLARLVGYDMSVGGVPVAGPEEAIARPGDRIDLKLVWQAMEPTRTSYIVFVHLLGPDGKVASQDDAVPGRGALPTSSWVRNEVLVDSYALPVPSTAMAGQYLIEVGMYDGVSGKRLQLWDANGSAIGDSLILTKVRVERAP